MKLDEDEKDYRTWVTFTNGGNQDRILETIESYSQNGNLVKYMLMKMIP